MARSASSLAQTIAARIRAKGPISLAEFMTTALSDPGAGYYMTGDPFGARGDFVTAPEISQIFGELIGLWCARVWQTMGEPELIDLVELGPGRGTLISDALRAAATLPGFRSAIRLHLVEISPSLRKRQRETLRDEEITWHTDLASLPRAPLIVIANEFFDALPVHQLERSGTEWLERHVTLSPLSERHNPVFTFSSAVASDHIRRFIPANLRETTTGTLLEVSPAVEDFAGKLARHLTGHGGTALVIDYGRTEPQTGWSLQALRQHRRHEPLVAPGEADLTAHVDFATLADTVRCAGAVSWGPGTQGAFLNALGIRERARRLCAGANQRQVRDIETAVARLTDGSQMGELFKVLAFGHPDLPVPAGFPVSCAETDLAPT